MEKEKKKIKFANKEITREKYPRVNLLSCIRCGVCEESCPASPKAIYLTTNFGGAALENQTLIVPTVH